jgi:cephalosporin hydroxylase
VPAPTYEELMERLRVEHERRVRAEELLAELEHSRTFKTLDRVHKVSKRGLSTSALADVTGAIELPTLPEASDDDVSGAISADFHRLYYDNDGQTWRNTYWLGVQTLKLPLDLWLYQELIVRTKPDVIIETGTWNGGSALYLASICSLLRRGRVITIDVAPREKRPQHPRIEYVTASSTDPDVVRWLYDTVAPDQRIMLILDSDHSERHVHDELAVLASLVTVGNHLIVEDTNVNGWPVRPDHGPGPHEAVEEFLRLDDRFEREPEAEKFFVSFNPGGVLRRVR